MARNLFKIKNGDMKHRRVATKAILTHAIAIGADAVFRHILHIWRTQGLLNLQKKHHFVDLMKKLLSRFGPLVRTCAREIIETMQPLLSDQEPSLREDGREVLSLLMNVIGLDATFDAIKMDFVHPEDSIRRHTARVIAIIAHALKPSDAIDVISGIATSSSRDARHTAAMAIFELAMLLKHGTLRVLPQIAEMLYGLIRDERRVKSDAAGALAQVAEAVAPYGIEHLDKLIPIVIEECRHSLDRTGRSFLKAFGAIVPLMSPAYAERYTMDLMQAIIDKFRTPADDQRTIMLYVIKQCIGADGIKPDFISRVLLEPFFVGFWSVRNCTSSKSYHLLVSTTVEMAKKVGSREILQYLINDMKDDNEAFQRMVVDAVRRVVDVVSTADLPENMERRLMDGAITAFNVDESGVNKVVLEGLTAVCKSLGKRLKPYLTATVNAIQQNLSSSNSAKRQQAGYLAASIAPYIKEADGDLYLTHLGQTVYNLLSDDQVACVGAGLKAVLGIMKEITLSKFQPTVEKVLKKLSPCFQRRDATLQLNAAQLLHYIASNVSVSDPRNSAGVTVELQKIALEGLFFLLGGEKRETRRLCAETFGIIAEKVRPFEIILRLVNNFNQEDIKHRICTAVALGAVAQRCGAMFVIPFIINEYRESAGQAVATIVQNTVLKVIRFTFELVGSVGKEYVYALLPLLQWALTATAMQHRRIAVEAVRALILSVVGHEGFEDIVIDLLNYVHPNILSLVGGNKVVRDYTEEQFNMVSAVVEVYEAARLVVGTPTIYQYIVQGLFHPATIVRDLFRRAYNILYIANPEALIPVYPVVNDTSEYRLERYELQLHL
jgi:splicing factor 3B subunit 1